jgi:hypothetical protein
MRTRKIVLPEYLPALNPAGPATAKSYLFNISPANYWPERFYAGGMDILAANHREIKDLAAKSGKKSDPDSNDLQVRPPFRKRRPACSKPRYEEKRYEEKRRTGSPAREEAAPPWDFVDPRANFYLTLPSPAQLH